MLLIHCYASAPYLRAPHHPAVHYPHRKTPASSRIVPATFHQPIFCSSSKASSRRRILVSTAVTTLLSTLISSAPSKSAINTDFFNLPNSGGVKALDLRTGTGETPVDGDQVAIHYYGRLAAKQGWRFDSTYDHKDSTGEPIPFVFTLGSGKVISGIEAAVRSMKVGGTRRVIIPPSQGYQNTSQEPIPPNILAVHFSSSIFCSAANKVSAIFVFGDSMVDVGKNYYINTIAKPSCPNEEELGFKDYSPPYLAPNTTGDVILKGVNYASSGAGILNDTGRILGERIYMDTQVSYFAKTKQDIISRIGKQAANTLLRKALYVLSIGTNDVIFQQFSETKDITIYLDDVFSRLKSQLTTLYNLGARKIALTNSPAVGCLPFERDLESLSAGCVSSLNELANLYNCRLRSLMQELTTKLSGSIFVVVDTYAIFEDIRKNYRSYGFETEDSACCRVIGQHGGWIPCGQLSRVCRDRTKYVFWDPFHPSETTNIIAAKRALDGGLEYVSPMNIRQLANF
ncbi:Lipase, GDSL [Corchorus olitorius]|uniref:peptidylprolyl isomerase n=1 Tax=Corchorus olitorius TaxID=93759 RepID=A0A1R3H6A3_9ROSI|nr:Lipase, GDSL [Corchorus olitorius]